MLTVGSITRCAELQHEITLSEAAESHIIPITDSIKCSHHTIFCDDDILPVIQLHQGVLIFQIVFE